MDNDATPQQRAGLIVWWLCHGEKLSTKDVARLAGLSMDGAYALMTSLSERIPIYCDTKHWQALNTPDCEGD